MAFNKERADLIAGKIVDVLNADLAEHPDDRDAVSMFCGLLLAVIAFASKAPRDDRPPEMIAVINAAWECLARLRDL